jgi:hypothetical protein
VGGEIQNFFKWGTPFAFQNLKKEGNPLIIISDQKWGELNMALTASIT